MPPNTHLPSVGLLSHAPKLLDEVAQIRSVSPTQHITVLCGAHARNDVVAALAAQGPWLNIDVVTISMYIATAARTLSPRAPLDRATVAHEVNTLLRTDAAPTVFHQHDLNDVAATRESLTNAVWEYLSLPEEQRTLDADSADATIELPLAVQRMALAVAASTAPRFFTPAEARAHAAEQGKDETIVVAGDIAFDTGDAWLLAQLKPTVTAFGPEQVEDHIRAASFVAENDEATYIATQASAALARGVPLHAMAVAYGSDSVLPYLHTALRRAHLPFAAPSPHTVSETPAARAVAILLRIEPERMSRRDLSDLLDTGVVATDISSFAFEQATRGFGPQLFAAEDWTAPLPAGLKDWQRDRMAQAQQWVQALRADLDRVWNQSSWNDVDVALRQLLAAHIRNDQRGAAEAALLALAPLEGPVHQTTAVEAINDFLENSLPDVNEGLLRVGPLESVAGRDLTHVFIAGATDAALPGTLTSSPTFTAAQTGVDSAAFLDRRRRALDAALTAAAHVFVTYSRTHVDGSGASSASLWIPVAAEDFGPVHALQSAGQMPLLDELDAAILRAQAGELTPETQRYLAIASAREAGIQTPYTGYIGSDAALRVFEKPLSASALETFTASPQLFFLERVAGGRILPDQGESVDIEAHERGTIYHHIFETFVREMWLDNEKRPSEYKDLDWDGSGKDSAKDAMQKIVEQELAVARPLRVNTASWEAFASRVRRECAAWLRAERLDAENGWNPLGVEVSFGPTDKAPNAAPLVIALPNGGSMSFRGSIDRVDVSHNTDGSINVRVTDYKSGKSKYSKHIDQDHPTGGEDKGYKFQLALYGETVRAALGRDGGAQSELLSPLRTELDGMVSLTARYWFFLDEEEQIVSIDVTDSVHDTLVDNLSAIYDYVQRGEFPAYDLSGMPFKSDALIRLSVENSLTESTALSAAGFTPLSLSLAATPTEA